VGHLKSDEGGGIDNDFQVTQLLGADIHEKVLAGRIVAINPLNRVLLCSGQLAVSTAELLEQHIAKTRIRLTDVGREH